MSSVFGTSFVCQSLFFSFNLPSFTNPSYAGLLSIFSLLFTLLDWSYVPVCFCSQFQFFLRQWCLSYTLFCKIIDTANAFVIANHFPQLLTQPLEKCSLFYNILQIAFTTLSLCCLHNTIPVCFYPISQLEMQRLRFQTSFSPNKPIH